MRKVFLLGALTAVASLSLGCALSDYPSIDIPTNKSHGLIDCVSSHDRIANTQQTSEPGYRELFFRDPATGGSFGPFALTGPVDRATAREWGRFIGPFAGIQGAGIRSTPCNLGVNCGQWEMGGVKDLADGSVRIATYYSDLPAAGFPPWTCGFGAPFGPGTEGGVLSQSLPGNAPPGGVSGRFALVDSIAIDNQPGQQWGVNMAAMTPARAAQGYSTMVGGTSRAAERNLMATPITRRSEASFGKFLNGSNETFTGPQGSDLEGWAISAWGEMTEQGVVAHVTGITSPNGSSYQAGETPLSVVLGELGSTTVQVETTPAESLKLALFAREAGLGDQDIVLPKHVDGIPMPPVTFRIGADAIDRKIDELTELLGGEGGDGGFGG